MENDDLLMGRYVRLLKIEQKISGEIESLLTYNGKFSDAMKQDTSSGFNDQDYHYKRYMSVRPERIIALAEELRLKQEALRKAHTDVRSFEAANPEIVKTYKLQ